MTGECTRVAQLQAAMAGSELDAVVLRLPESIVLATGYWPQMGGLGLVLVPGEGEATLVAPAHEEADVRRRWSGPVEGFAAGRLDMEPAAAAIARLLRALAGRHGLEGATIGYEGGFELVAPPRFDGEPGAVAEGTRQLIRAAFQTDRLVDVTRTLDAIRLVKTDAEIERLRLTNEIAAFGLDAFKEHALAGRTEASLAAVVEAAIVSDGHGHRGARTVRAYATVCSGAATATAWQYFLHGDRRIERDDVVMLELGTCVDGYWSDHTRTVVAGTATDGQREAMAAVLAGVDAALAAAVPGASGGDVDRASRSAVRAGGFEQFPHHTGHGTGFRYHEAAPLLVPDGVDVLRAGMVLAIEPGVYREGLGGFRWEDDAVLGAGGPERLTRTSYGFE